MFSSASLTETGSLDELTEFIRVSAAFLLKVHSLLKIDKIYWPFLCVLKVAVNSGSILLALGVRF